MRHLSNLSDYVRDGGQRRTYPTGQTVFSPDEICRGLYLVLRGHLNVSRPLPTGEILLIRQIRAGEVFGEVLVFAEERFSGWISAGVETEIVSLTKPRVEELLVSNTSFRKLFFSEIGNRVKHLGERVEILSRKTVSERLLLWLAQNGGIRHCTRQEAANQLGCSREALSRCVTEMSGKGIIRSARGRIEEIPGNLPIAPDDSMNAET